MPSAIRLPVTTALLLIDIQNDFCPGGALAVKDGDQVIPVANKLAASTPLVVASQDWHPKNHGSFASASGKPLFGQFDLNGLPQTAWPDHCVAGSVGASLHPALDQTRIAAVFRKGMDPTVDSYSAFFDNARRNDTGLGAYLKGRGITDVIVMGLATDYCVRFSALDAASLGFRTYVVTDGCRGVNISPTDSTDALAAMLAGGVTPVTSGEIA